MLYVTLAMVYQAPHAQVVEYLLFYLGSAEGVQGEMEVCDLVQVEKVDLVVVFLFQVLVPFPIPPVRKMIHWAVQIKLLFHIPVLSSYFLWRPGLCQPRHPFFS